MKSLFLVLFWVASLALAETGETTSTEVFERPRKALRLGPTLNIVGFPTPLRLGVEGRLYQHVGFGAEVGFIPGILTAAFMEAATRGAGSPLTRPNLSLWNANVGLRFFPMGGSFFLGLLGGLQQLSLGAQASERTDDGRTVRTEGEILWTLISITPTLGWRFELPSGFFFGIDLGYQLPISSTVAVNSDVSGITADERRTISARQRELLDATRSQAQQAVRQLENKLPFLSLIRIGWLL